MSSILFIFTNFGHKTSAWKFGNVYLQPKKEYENHNKPETITLKQTLVAHEWKACKLSLQE
jgi:hypothetical protein